MADRYWVGGSGSWDATTTTNWSATSGGAGGASAPTSSDNVIFNSASNATLYTVTVGTDAACADITAAGALVGNVTFSLGATAVISCFGSFTLAATGITWTASVGGSFVYFKATTTGKTVTTNGVSFGASVPSFDGVGGGWTLGSALTSGGSVQLLNGSLNTGNFNITASNFGGSGTGVREFILGSSTITLSGAIGWNAGTSTNFTLNAGTSTITCSNASPAFAGGGLTFYNVNFTSNALGATTITGANTFNDLNQTSRSATGLRIFTLGANQTVSGTLTLGAANTSIRRIQVTSDIVGTQRTITLNGTLATLADVDFRNIATAGSVGTWTGTRIGNGLGNNGITFTAAKDVYWNLAAGGNWSATGWATTSGGTPNANNFPLGQDKIIIENTGLNTSATITFDTNWWLGELDASTRSNAMTLASAAIAPRIYKNVTLSSAVTMTGTGAWQFFGQGTTQILDVNTATFVPPITIDSPGGTLQLAENTTCSSTVTLTSGTLNLNNNVLTCNVFTSSNTNTRAISFGTASININGRNATILTISQGTFSYTGTPTINLTGAGIGGETRNISLGNSTFTESNAIDLYVTTGADTVASTGVGMAVKKLDFTGFTGTFTRTLLAVQFGNLLLSSSMTYSASENMQLASTGTQSITTNGITINHPLTQLGVGGTVQLQDNLTMGSTRTFTLTNGTLDLSSGNRTLSCGLFNSSNSNTRSILFGTGNITLTGNDTAIWTTNITTGLSVTGTPTVNCTYSGSTGTRTITCNPSGAEAIAISFNINAGTDIITTGSGSMTFKNLNFTGFSGTLTNRPFIIYGNLTYTSGMILSAGTFATNLFATSGTQLITTNGNTTIDFPITQDGIGGTVRLQDNLTMGATRTYTLTNGSFDINDKILSCGLFASSNTNTRTLDLGTDGKIEVTGTSFTVNPSGLTMSGTGIVSMDSATTKTFAGGGGVYPYALNQGGIGNLTITGANTFQDMTNTVQPCTIIFPASTTTSVYNFNVNGTDGNLVLLRSSTPGTRYTLARLV
jgi:hypothetical protein